MRHFWLSLIAISLGAAAVAQAAPSAPVRLTAKPGNTTVGLIWEAPAGSIENYFVYYGGVTLSVNPALTAPAPTGFLATGLENGTYYTFTVSAVSGGVEGPPSAPVTARPAVPPPAPGGGAAAAVIAPAPQVNLSWSAAPQQTLAVAGYALYRTCEPPNFSYYAYVTAPALTLADAGVTTLGAFASYAYRIAAVDADGNLGALSNTLTALLVPDGAPSTPLAYAAAATAAGMHLTWTPTFAADGYQLTVSLTPDNAAPLQTLALPDVSSADVALAADGRLYYFSLAAVRAGILGPRLVVAARALPPEVTGTASAAGPGYAQLTWDAAAADAGVTAYRITSAGVWVAETAVNRFTDTVPQTSYLIQTLNASGASPAGVTVTPAAPGLTPPAPTGFTAAFGVSQSLTFSWDPNPVGAGVDHYDLTAYDGPFSTLTLAASETTTTPAFAFVNGTAYRFALAAVDSSGNSAYSSVLTTAPMARPNTLTAAAQVQANTVLLSWEETGSPAAAAYVVSRYEQGTYRTLTVTTQLAWADSGLENGTYTYRLQALNALGQLWTATPDFTLIATVSQPPAPPGRLVVSPGDQRVRLVWQAVASATTYNLYRSQTPGVASAPIQRGLGAKILQFVDTTGLINTQRYYYSLSAVNEAGESTRSAEAAVIPFVPPVLPENAEIRSTQLRRSVRLEWNASAAGSYPLIGYNLYRSEDGGGSFTLLGNSPTAAVLSSTISAYAYIDGEVAYGATYIYRLHAVDHDAANALWHEGPAYPVLNLHLDAPMNRIEVYRNAFNPARGESVPVMLVAVQSGRTWIKIYNLSGEWIRTLFDQDLAAGYSEEYPFVTNLAWDGRNDRGQTVASGVYLIHAEGQSRYHQTRKVAVIK